MLDKNKEELKIEVQKLYDRYHALRCEEMEFDKKLREILFNIDGSSDDESIDK